MKRKHRFFKPIRTPKMLMMQEAHLEASQMLTFHPGTYFQERENAERKLDALCIAEQLYCMSLGLA
jgi:hypothetical protein